MPSLNMRLLKEVKHLSKLYGEQRSKINFFAKIVNGWNPLTAFAENIILDIWQGSEQVSGKNGKL